jgi:uncharacterized membrane protein YgdD (TMEM256/DUF423 family)
MNLHTSTLVLPEATGRWILPLGGLLLAVATALGAFGAHALQSVLTPERLAVYETAVMYHFFHALGLLVIGILHRQGESAWLRWAAMLVTAGIVLFAGSIYAIVFGAPRALGMVTPLGGATLMAAWVLFAVAMARRGA